MANIGTTNHYILKIGLKLDMKQYVDLLQALVCSSTINSNMYHFIILQLLAMTAENIMSEINCSNQH